MSYNYLPLDRKWLNFQQVKNLLDFNQLVSITFDAHERILKCRQYLDNKLKNKEDLVCENIDAEVLYESYATESGEEVPADVAKLMLMLKIKSLTFGHSGVRIDIVKRLMEMYNHQVYPAIYTSGINTEAISFVPLSYLVRPLTGHGKVFYNGLKRQLKEVLEELGWEPLRLEEREALALLNGTQFISAYALFVLKKASQLLEIADAIAALSFDVSNCNKETFHPKLQPAKGCKGQVQTASTISAYLNGSNFSQGKTLLLDSASFYNIPQVHGAAKDSFEYVLNIFLTEINSVSDNPAIFPDDDLILTRGNPTGQHLALAIDFLSIAMTELAGLSAERTAKLNSEVYGRPVSLVKNSGANDAFETLHNAAADLVNQIKQLTIPAANGEERLSPYAGVNSLQVVNSVEKILAIELLCAAQAIEFRRPAKTSKVLERLLANFREYVSVANNDRVFDRDIVKAIDFIGTYNMSLQNPKTTSPNLSL